MATAFGKFCRKLRIDYNELLKDMADRLDVKSSFLSAVELGKKNIPAKWREIIIDEYCLEEALTKELDKAIEMSVRTVKINLEESTDEERELVISFARKLELFSDEDKKKLWKILD